MFETMAAQPGFPPGTTLSWNVGVDEFDGLGATVVVVLCGIAFRHAWTRRRWFLRCRPRSHARGRAGQPT